MSHPLFSFLKLCPDDVDEVLSKLVHRCGSRNGEGDVHRCWRLQSVEMPSLSRQFVGDVIDVDTVILARPGDNADERLSNDHQVFRKDWVLTNGRLELLCCRHDLVAALNVSRYPHTHETSPAACNQSARPGSCHGGRGIDTARPIRIHKVLIAAVGTVAVEKDGVALGSETILVGVNTDTRDARLTEVETALFLVRGWITRLLEEGNHEGAQAAVNVQGNLVLGSKTGKSGDVVDNAMREVRRRAHQEDSVWVDKTANSTDVDFIVGCWAWNTVQFDLEVFASLVECSMSSVGNDPV